MRDPVRGQAGFTLIELLVVILTIALLMAFALPAFLNQQERALDAAAKQDLTLAFKQVEKARVANEGVYPKEAALQQAIAAEPTLKVRVVRQVKDLPAGEHTIGVSLASTDKQVVLLAPSQSGTTWRLRADGTAKPVTVAVGARPAAPAAPFPFKTVGIVIGIILVLLLVLAAVIAVGINYNRRRQVRLLTEQSLAEWARLLEPGFAGPLTPEEGYEILAPEKRQQIVDGTRVDIDFRVALYRFEASAWKLVDDEVTVDDLSHKTKTAKDAARADSRKRFLKRLVGIKKPSSAYPSKPEFERLERDIKLTWPADTDIAVLAEAWFDFCERVHTQNRMQWAKMEEQWLEDELRQEELERQLEIAELLDGHTTYDDLTNALKQARPKPAKL